MGKHRLHNNYEYGHRERKKLFGFSDDQGPAFGWYSPCLPDVVIMSRAGRGVAGELRGSKSISITQEIDNMGVSLLEIKRMQEDLVKADDSLSTDLAHQVEVFCQKNLDRRSRITKRALDDSEESEERRNLLGTSSASQRKVCTSESIVIFFEDETVDLTSINRKKGRELKDKRRKIKNSPFTNRDVSMEDREDFDMHFSLEGKSRVEQELTGLEIAHASEVHERMNVWITKMKIMRRK